MRTRLVAAGVGVLALTLGGCAQGSATAPVATTDGQTVVRYLNFGANDGNEDNLDAIVTAFEAENPDVDVQVETRPFDDYFTTLQTAIAGGTAPDAFELNYENFVSFADSGALAPLDGVDAAAYSPALLEAYARDGAQYGLPSSFSNVVLFYNKTLFDAAGVAVPTDDWTWADEQAAAEALTDAEAGVWGDYQSITYNEYYKALAQTGGDFLSPDGTAAAFNSPEGLRAAQWLVGKNGVTMPTEADGAGTPDFDSELFASGDLAMWHSGIWMFDGLADAPFEWDVVVEPGDTEKASAMFVNGQAVSATAADPAAAQRWISYLASSDTTTQVRLDNSWELPPVADQTELEPYLSQPVPANREAVFASLDATVLPPVVARQQEMQDAVTDELGEAAAGRKSVEQALTDAETAVNGLLGSP